MQRAVRRPPKNQRRMEEDALEKTAIELGQQICPFLRTFESGSAVTVCGGTEVDRGASWEGMKLDVDGDTRGVASRGSQARKHGCPKKPRQRVLLSQRSGKSPCMNHLL